MSGRATTLIAAIENAPIRMEPRRRIMWALNVIASSEWDRVLIKLDGSELKALATPCYLSKESDVSYVLEVAQTVAASYSFSHTDVGHIAVALALTMDGPVRDNAVCAVVAEAFGLGTLEDVDKISDVHFRRMQDSEFKADPGFLNVVTDKAERTRSAAIWIHLGIRVAAFVLLVAVAIADGHWFGWIAAIASLVSTRDIRVEESRIGEPVKPLELYTGFPWLLVVAVACSLAGLHGTALVILILAILTEAVSIWGESAYGKGIHFSGPLPGTLLLPENLGISSLLDVHVAYRRARRLRRALHLTSLQAPFLGIAWLVSLVLVSWPAFAIVAVLAARRHLLLSIVASGLHIWLASWTPLTAVIALGGGLVARLLLALEERPPGLRMPISPLPAGWIGVRQSWLLYRSKRLVRLGRAESAIRLITEEATKPLCPELLAVLGWAQVNSGRPGAAKTSVASLTGNLEGMKLLVVALAELELSNSESANNTAHQLMHFIRSRNCTQGLRIESIIAASRIDAVHIPSVALTNQILGKVPRQLRKDSIIDAVRLLRAASESCLSSEPRLASVLAGMGFAVTGTYSETPSGQEYVLLAPARTLLLEGTRCLAIMSLADASVDGFSSEAARTLGTREGATFFLLQNGRPIDAAAVLNQAADLMAADPGHELDALTMRLEAIAALNGLRHGLEDRSDRDHWWSVLGRTLESAMDQASHGRDWSTLAELIETARFQQTPGLTAREQVPPVVRVRGISRLEECSWYEPDVESKIFALEDLASAVLGSDTVWWSTWSTTEKMYWSVVAPKGPVYGGVWDLESDGIRSILRDLADAIPVPHANEPQDEFDFRLLRSPLNGRSDTETHLSSQLGRLVPAPLIDLLKRSTSVVPVAVSPSSVLSTVPWTSAILPGTTDTRVVEKAILAIAPPAALLNSISNRPVSADGAPLRLAIVDPAGDLPRAAELKPSIPSDVQLLTADSVPSLETVQSLLQHLPREATVLFACHTKRLDLSPTGNGLLISYGKDSSGPQILTTGNLTQTDDFPMPEQVILLACASGELSATSSGEWHVLGTAVLWAGANRAVITSYPIIDNVELDRSLIETLGTTRDLQTALRSAQLRQLEIMRSTAKASDNFGLSPGAPILWGGHIALGSFTSRPSLPERNTSRNRYASEWVVKGIDDASSLDAARGRRSCSLEALIASLIVGGFHDSVPFARRTVISVLGYLWYLWVLLRGKLRGQPDHPDSLDAALREVLRTAGGIARRAKHKVIDIDHLIVAILQQESRLGRAGRFFTGWDARKPDVAKTLLSEVDQGYRTVGLPKTSNLAPAVVGSVYESLGIVVPPEDNTNHHISEL